MGLRLRCKEIPEPALISSVNCISASRLRCSSQHSTLPQKSRKILMKKMVKWAVQSARGDPWPEIFNLTCSDCGQDFTFTAADQAFFQERGYSTPKRCKPCRMAKKNDQGGGGSGYRSAPAQGTPVICSGCGQPTTVPFEPRGDRPVLLQGLLPGAQRQRSRRRRRARRTGSLLTIFQVL